MLLLLLRYAAGVIPPPSEVNTRNKRAAIISYKIPGVGPFPNPDGAINTPGDRGHIVGEYPGVLIITDGPPGIDTGVRLHLPRIALRISSPNRQVLRTGAGSITLVLS